MNLENNGKFIYIFFLVLHCKKNVPKVNVDVRRKPVICFLRVLLRVYRSVYKMHLCKKLFIFFFILVNVVVVGAFGMSDATPGNIRRIPLDDYLLTHYVEAIVDYGATSNIKVTEGNVDKVRKIKSLDLIN